MTRNSAILLFLAILFLAGCVKYQESTNNKQQFSSTGTPESEKTPEPETSPSQSEPVSSDTDAGVIRVWEAGMYGRARCQWEKPGQYKDREGDYTVIIESVGPDGSTRELAEGSGSYESFETTDYIAWACQENGFPDRMQYRVRAWNDGQLIAEGCSEPFDPRRFFPEKEVLEIGRDIPEADIEGLDYHGSGDFVEANFLLSVEKEDDGRAEIEGTYYKNSKQKKTDKKLKASDWEELMALIRQGSVVRKHVMDPEIMMLDGSSTWFFLDWEDQSDLQEMWYVFRADDAVEQQIIDWMYRKAD